MTQGAFSHLSKCRLLNGVMFAVTRLSLLRESAKMIAGLMRPTIGFGFTISSNRQARTMAFGMLKTAEKPSGNRLCSIKKPEVMEDGVTIGLAIVGVDASIVGIAWVAFADFLKDRQARMGRQSLLISQIS
jgi:hypothetical protein